MNNNKPLSDKAKSLLQTLKSSAPEKKSQYIEGLVESANRRRVATEAAIDRKFAREEAERGDSSNTLTFVTKDFETRNQDSGDRLVERVFVQNAEKIDASKHHKPRNNSAAAAAPVKKVELSELLKKREERRSKRIAPPSKLTPELIEQARERAIKRLG